MGRRIELPCGLMVEEKYEYLWKCHSYEFDFSYRRMFFRLSSLKKLSESQIRYLVQCYKGFRIDDFEVEKLFIDIYANTKYTGFTDIKDFMQEAFMWGITEVEGRQFYWDTELKKFKNKK